MNATRIWRLLSTLIAVGAIWAFVTPAQAQLASGCTCPSGSTPFSSTTCIHVSTTTTFPPAICPYHNISHIAAAQQQQSFWGIATMLTQKRDQLQSASGIGGTSTEITGYAASPLDSNGGVLSYSSQSKKDNPLASPLYDDAAPTPPAPVWGAWAQGLGDWEHDNPLQTGDLGRFTSTYAAQAGFDRTQQGIFSADDAFVFGVVGSWTGSHTSFDGTSTTMGLTGPGVGLYSEYVRGGFSADLTAKVDFLQMVQEFGGTAPNTSIAITNAGLSGNMQYKVNGFLGLNNNFIEPTAGFTLTHTGFASGAAALGLEDAYTVRLQAGARIGTTWDAGRGVSIDSSLKILAYGNAVAQSTSTNPTTPSLPIAPSDTGLVRGELDPELCFNLPNDYSVTVSGQFRFGEAIVGGSAGVNLRKQF
jgi:hypothetical protein